MQLTKADIAKIRTWAGDQPEILEVWLYGSRARGNNRDNSDIDLAIVTAGEDFGSRFSCWAFGEWRTTLKLSREVHLEWHDPNTSTEKVGPGVEQDGICLYRMEAKD